MRRIPGIVPLLACAALLSAASAWAQKTQLLVYTALETDQLKAYQEGFNKVEPNIEIKWVRDSTGVITAKLLAEKANPQADVIRGVAASSLALFDQQGMLEPYAPLNLDAIMTELPRQEESAGLVGHGRVGRDGLLQHRRGAEEEHPQARDLEGPDQAGLQGPDRDAEPGLVGHRLLRRHRLAARCGATTTARAAAGSTWTRCTRTSRSTRTRAPSPATWRPPASTWSASRSSTAANTQQGQGRADRPGVPEGRPGLGPRGVRDPQGHEEARRGEEARRLGVEQGRDDAVRQELRDHRAARRRAHAGQRAGRLRVAPGQDGLHLRRRATASASWPSGTSATTPRSEKR